MLKHLSIALGAAALSSTIASAQSPSVTFSKDGRQVTTARDARQAGPAVQPGKGLVTIFSNLATDYPKGVYFCCVGSTLSGPTAQPDQPEWWHAIGFTPDTDRLVKEIDVGATYIWGTNDAVVLSLYTDHNGLPGTPVKSWHAKGLPTFGACCALAVVKDRQGVSVHGGVPYWIVVSTDRNDKDIMAAMTYNTTDQIDTRPEAYYCSADKSGNCLANDQWAVSTDFPPLALGVFGQ